MRYIYKCACGVSIEAASDKGLLTSLERHQLSSQIHFAYEHEQNR